METKLPDLIRFGREICGDLAQAERREWWLANGLGGYAAGPSRARSRGAITDCWSRR